MHLTPAGNTDTCAIGELHAMGYAVTAHGATFRAERPGASLTAKDPLQLLGLACLVERRGPMARQPTDAEVDAALALNTNVGVPENGQI